MAHDSAPPAAPGADDSLPLKFALVIPTDEGLTPDERETAADSWPVRVHFRDEHEFGRFIAKRDGGLAQVLDKKRVGREPVNALTDDAIVNQRCAPVPRDLYLRFAREGGFASKKVGKRIVARWGDVRAAFAGHRSGPPIAKAKPPPVEPEDDGLDEIRRAAGLVPKRGR